MESFEHEKIIRLVADYLSGNADDMAREDLEQWMRTSSVNRTYFLQLKNIWDASAKPLEHPEKISAEALSQVLQRLDKSSPGHGVWFYWQKVAAVLFIPVLLGSLFWIKYSTSKFSSQVVYNELYAPPGTRSSVKLADGTQVQLNSGSSLKYPDRFLNGERVVYLKGEAYFEVHSDQTSPFIVKTDAMSVKATGTKFNVQAFTGDTLSEVTLVKGKVSVAANTGNGQPSFVTEMVPNQHLVFNARSNKTNVRNVDVYRFISWKDGKLVFRNEPLIEVVKKIGKRYNVDIELQGQELQHYSYRATFEEESLGEVLKLLKLSSPIDYKEIKRQPLADGTFSKCKIIIYPLNKKIDH
jgi:transmembrane sensor